MIPVAWCVYNSRDWIGGLNYFINLASALFSLPDRIVEPVLLGPSGELPNPLNTCRILPYPHIPQARWHPRHVLNAIQCRLFDNGGLLSAYLKHNGVMLLSHSFALGKNSPVPAMSWIPDFQHVHYPDFFSQQERQKRDQSFNDVAERAQAVLLSSESARKDFIQLFPNEAYKTHVLHFVACISDKIDDIKSVLRMYNIDEQYIYIPNQVWVHKNHKIVVDALSILKKQGKCPLIVCTGHTKDYRRPSYFQELTAYIQSKDLSERIRFLGVVKYDHVIALMRESMAIINPSLFEGWSTSVEEAKSIGKRIILSDIEVHREQNPAYGIFFEPHNAEQLAILINDVINEYDKDVDATNMRIAEGNLPDRIKKYGYMYQDIVLQITSSGNKY